MQGHFADSGSNNDHDTVSVLEYTVTLTHAGAALFSFTSDGELGFDYLKFFVNGKELSLTTKNRVIKQWLAVTPHPISRPDPP